MTLRYVNAKIRALYSSAACEDFRKKLLSEWCLLLRPKIWRDVKVEFILLRRTLFTREICKNVLENIGIRGISYCLEVMDEGHNDQSSISLHQLGMSI